VPLRRRMVVGMAVVEHDLVFVGGGLAALLLLHELGPALPDRVAVVDPHLPRERPTVHWSYWSSAETTYDRFATGIWQRARVADGQPEHIAPFALRLVRSTDVFAHLDGLLASSPIEWLQTRAYSITGLADGRYEIVTDAGTLRATWVFDSATDVPPTFPPRQGPQAVESGTGVRVEADSAVFDPATATLFDPLDESSFAYLLPLSSTEALLESATFGPVGTKEDQASLLRYLRTSYPGAGFTVSHAESGSIPLGFAPRRTAGPRHVLLGTKRGLVKPSAGYGIVRIAEESKRLASLWRDNLPVSPSRQSAWWWRFLDTGFLRLAAHDPRLPLALLQRVMGAVPLAQSLRFIDEDLPPRQLLPLIRAALPIVLGKKR
jgi:lycopene beta-cyclase